MTVKKIIRQIIGILSKLSRRDRAVVIGWLRQWERDPETVEKKVAA